MKKFKWDKKYLYWGITAFFVIAAAIVFYMLLNYVGVLSTALRKLTAILSPFIWGLVIAYLLVPLMGFYENRLCRPFVIWIQHKTKSRKKSKAPRALAVIMSIVTLIIIIAALIYLILPQLYTSIETIVVNSPAYVKTGVEWVEKMLESYPEIEEYAVSIVGNIGTALSTWFNESVLPGIDSMVQNVTSGVYYFLKGIYNMVIGLIVSIYILHNKEGFTANCKKILYSAFSLEHAKKIHNGVSFSDKVFMGFITGKLLDSAIIGLMCYIFCAVADMPYALLVSVIVGVTNIIPFFGPFIGAVPSALLILLVSPMKCLIFIIFIILLQQFDGNILGPKILGNTTGVSGFWVMFSIILGAGLFGFWGMLLGVPVWVIIFTWMNNHVDSKLRKNDLPDDAEFYKTIEYIEPETRSAVYKDTAKTGKKRRTAPDKRSSGKDDKPD